MTAVAASVVGVSKTYPGRGRQPEVHAVRDVGFELARGESLAIVGESGSGKTTLARMIVGLERPSFGEIRIGGVLRPSRRTNAAERRRWGRRTQLVFQDPYASLDPRQRIGASIAEVVALHFPDRRARLDSVVAEQLARVGLEGRFADAFPRQLSGGQRQRVAIARALAAEPEVLVLDEAVAALDVSIRAQIINLLTDLREELGLSYLFVSHDLAVLPQVTDRTIVMRRGSVVEIGATLDLLRDPQHPYTQLLRDSLPRPGWRPVRRNRSAELEAS